MYQSSMFQRLLPLYDWLHLILMQEGQQEPPVLRQMVPMHLKQQKLSLGSCREQTWPGFAEG